MAFSLLEQGINAWSKGTLLSCCVESDVGWVRDAAKTLFLSSRILQNHSKIKHGNIYNHVSDKGLVSRIYKELLQFNNKIQTIHLKNGERREQSFLPKRHTDGQEAHEICCYENVNQNHSEVTLHSHYGGC